jgi:hypothetical protein
VLGTACQQQAADSAAAAEMNFSSNYAHGFVCSRLTDVALVSHWYRLYVFLYNSWLLFRNDWLWADLPVL